MNRAEAVNEYERERVPDSKVKSFRSFINLVSAEHIAGTEFVIGPLFVIHGASARDVFLGLLIGNLLATLSWALVCAPTAVKVRLTINYQLEKICGYNLVSIFNVLNGILSSVAAAAMIGVSASAIGILVGVRGPGLTSLYPESAAWVFIIVIVGAVIAVVAAFGFDLVARFSSLFAPWMPLVFLAAGIAMLPQLGLTHVGDFWSIANEKIWTGIPVEGQSHYTIWHIVMFSWLCNNSMHIGLGDMTIYRYARRWYYGAASAFGMFIGHFMAWIASGILCAVALQNGSDNPSPGEIAFMGAGMAGLICVVVAGWTTANPTIYRAGLSVQALCPNLKRWKITASVGVLATFMACFPALISKIDQLLGLYAFVAAPVGAVLIIDIFVFPRLGLISNLAAVTGLKFNFAVALTWLASLVSGYALFVYFKADFYFFMALPGWFLAAGLYLGLGYFQQYLLADRLRHLVK